MHDQEKAVPAERVCSVLLRSISRCADIPVQEKSRQHTRLSGHRGWLPLIREFITIGVASGVIKLTTKSLDSGAGAYFANELVEFANVHRPGGAGLIYESLSVEEAI
jgi:hypothetical protein